MSLLASVSNTFHAAVLQVYVDGRPVDAISARVDHGYDSISGAARLVLGAVPDGLALRDEIEVWMGYDGRSIPVFRGFLEDDDRGYFPFNNELKAAGNLKLAQYQYPSELSYSSQTDTAIVIDLLTKAGVSRRNIEGDGTTLGTVEDVVLRAGQATWDLINNLDQMFGYKTFDGGDGMVHRLLISGVPSNTAAFAYIQGTNIISISRPRTVRSIHNKVIVTGRPQETFTVGSTWQAANTLVPDPPKYIPFEFRSEWIETDAIATTIAQRIIGEVNRVVEEIDLEVPGNPWLAPGMTVSVLAAQVGIDVTTPFFIKHITQTVGQDGFVSKMVLEGGIGQFGYEVNKPPIPIFTYRVTKETLVAGLQYTVTCDGTASWDRDGSPDELTFSWSNNKNGDTSTDSTYSTNFSQADMDASPTITLTVTDGPGDSASVTHPISQLADPVLEREIYVAVTNRAEASPDGGATWNTWTPGAGTVISTPQSAALAQSYFGLSDGKLHLTLDYLATAPTEVHDFGSQINAIWMNEQNVDRVTVGLANGEIHVTNDAILAATATWTLLKTYGSAVLHIRESSERQGEYRVATGTDIRLTYDNFVTDSQLLTFAAGTARHIAVNLAFSTYGSATHADEVKRADGTVITGIATSDVRAIAPHIRDDILYAIDTAGQSYSKPADSDAFGAEGALGGTPGQVNHMVEDPDNQLILFAVSANALYKSIDAAVAWAKIRDYSAAGPVGLQVGVGSFKPRLLGIGAAHIVGRLADGTITIIETVNISGASPTWTAVGAAGLPNADGRCQFFRDPYDPVDIAILVARVAGGDELWRTTNLSEGPDATWAKILDLASVNTALGQAHTDLAIGDAGNPELPALSYTVAVGDFVMVALSATGDPGGNELAVAHSHTGGLAWPTYYSFGQPSGAASNILLGQWSEARAWIVIQPALAIRGWRSTDHGHGFSLLSEQGYGVSGERILLLFPVDGNESQQNLYRLVMSGQNVDKNTGGGEDSAWVALTEDVDWTASQVAHWDHRRWYWKGSGTDLESSDDELATKRTDAVTDVPDDVLHIALPRAGVFMFIDGARRVWTTIDWGVTAPVEATGNLATLFPDGTLDVLSPSLLSS